MRHSSNVETVRPYADSTACKRDQIERVFDGIAPAYDRLNRILSFGIDLSWRKRALRQLAVNRQPVKILDVATGTGDFALLAARQFPSAQVVGMDLSAGMIAVGKKKCGQMCDRIRFCQGDALKPPFDAGSFDAVTVAFGVRNFQNLLEGFFALRRLLRSGGALLILELSRPTLWPFSALHRFYLRHILPRVGKQVSGFSDEYAYLAASVAQVPQGNEMVVLLRKAGFDRVKVLKFTFGACSCYLAGTDA